MSKIVQKLSKIVKSLNIDIKNNYQTIRKVLDFLHIPKFKLGYEFWDYRIKIKKHEIPVRMFYPKNEGNHSVIIFFHGGGWVTGNIDSYTKVCKHLAINTDSIVLSVDYRLAPENKFPIGLMDCYEVTKYILKNTKILNTTKDKITIMGDSAGANIAAAISLRLRDYKEYIPQKQILLYPLTIADHNNTTYKSVTENKENLFLTLNQVNDYIDLYKVKELDKKNPYMSPYLTKNFKNQPDTLIITAEYDILRDEGEDYGEKLKQAGNKVIIKRMSEVQHGFLRFKNSKTMQEVYKHINNFLKENDIDE